MADAISNQQTALIIVMDFYPEMAIKMIQEWSPNKVSKMIKDDPNNEFMETLHYSEQKLIKALMTDGFNKLDITLLYKLIRYFKLVDEPSKTWGTKPSATDKNHGDDMERMRYNRNNLFHRPRGGLSKEDTDKLFNESIEIARRMDNFVRKSTISFETGIRNAKINHITQEKHRQTEEKFVKLQQQMKIISGKYYVNLYYGNDITVKLGHEDLPATESTPFTIYVRDVNVNVSAIIEQFKKILNEGKYEIKLLEAESGSLVLHVEINNLCFKTKDSLHKAIAEFLCRVFTFISGSLDQHIMEVVLAECDSFIISAINSGATDLLTESIPTELQVSNSHSAEPVMMENSSVMSQVTNNESTNVQTDASLDLNPATDSQEPTMPVTEYVSSSKVFFEVDPKCGKLPHKFARLFDKEETRRLTISFKEATERLQTAVENSLCDVENIASLKVTEFKIGKASVMSKEKVHFDPMEPKTWGEVGGIIEKLQEYKRDNYDGLIAVGCVINELIPKVIKETNIVIPVDHQMYAIGMAQALVHHYMVHVPDGRLRNKSFGIGNCSEENRGDQGGIIYVAYKLEPKNISKLLDGLAIKEEKQVMRCSVFKEEEQEIAESTALLDDNASPSKLRRMTQEDQRFRTSTSSPVQGTSHEKNLEEANVSEVESEKGPKEENISTVRKNMTTDERKLILLSYKKRAIDWDKLVEEVYEKRNQHLSTDMVKHYEDLHEQSKLKERIKSFIQRVKGGNVGKELDQENIALMIDVCSN